ncbi:TetR/AcrR family transcriptional regulator [Weissella viridescens]|uniref:TetR/AcrR family transcriptional regulator n=1 Tax=Weissella viridescens TaxID=1629 RepID=UPI001D08B82F|nr:TetR/AcrR family transcriptional regulator [Weissella viridescens]MCB6839412.1 TetR/AcrR family transcriptional regulator [Weissella viridescens]MCB6846143.1 TetR/AcrR family transcriptional regulator [Weissella viridescens]
MVSPTFEKLKPEKKERLKRVLIEEFSNYTLDQAQVARIVKKAGISRGSFYTYFSNLYDAYHWTLTEILQNVHHFRNADPLAGTIAFIENLPHNPYYDFLDKYFQINETLLRTHAPELSPRQAIPTLEPTATDQTVRNWLAMISTHSLIQERFAFPDHADDILQSLRQLSIWIHDQES